MYKYFVFYVLIISRFIFRSCKPSKLYTINYSRGLNQVKVVAIELVFIALFICQYYQEISGYQHQSEFHLVETVLLGGEHHCLNNELLKLGLNQNVPR